MKFVPGKEQAQGKALLVPKGNHFDSTEHKEEPLVLLHFIVLYIVSDSY